MNHGFIKLWRSSVDNPLYFAEPFTKWQAWVDLLILANHKPNTVSVRGILINVDRGQVLAGEDFLAERWKWSRGKVRRFQSYLSSKTVQQTVQQKDNVCTLISIVNYNRYQDVVQQTVQQTDSRKPADGQQTDTLKNDKNEENEKNNSGDDFDPAEEALQKLSEPRRDALRLWQRHCTENRRDMKPTALALLLDKWKDVSDARFIAAVKYSIGNNYNGIYEEGTKQGKQKKVEVGIR